MLCLIIVVVKSERCQSVLSKAMDYSGDKNYLTGLTQKIVLRETCPGEFDDFIVTFWKPNGAIWKMLNKQS